MAKPSELILPRQQARANWAVKIWATRGGYDGSVPPAGDPSTMGTLVQIGAMQSITIDNKREAGFWRQLDWSTYGLIQETYPGLPTYDLTLKRIVLYRSNMLEEFGFLGEDVANQTQPLLISIDLVSPPTAPTPNTINVGSDALSNTTPVTYLTGDPVQNAPKRKLYLTGVWFKNNPLTLSVQETDIRIDQDVEAICANIMSV